MELVALVSSVLDAEGGFWADPIGGNTKFGIRQVTLDGVRHKFPNVDLPKLVEDLDEATARVILEQEYLRAFRVDEMPSVLGLPIAHGVVMAWDDIIICLQEALGFSGKDVDGIVGSKTLAAIKKLTYLELLEVTADTVQKFLETRTNAYVDSYRTRFNELHYV